MASSNLGFDLPSSSSAVKVKVFNAFRLLTDVSGCLFSAAPGSTTDEGLTPLSSSGKSFLVEHAPSGKKVVFDLGTSKNVRSMPPLFQDLMQKGTMKLDFGPDVAETLTDAGIDLASIDAVIWSHSHFDHTGDPSTFPASTKLLVGPGTQAHCRPGFPLNPDALVLEKAFLGREVIEIEYPEHGLSINGMKALDYFKDGSFYLLNAPGHCPGHMVGLARTTPTTFILMGADVAHHPAMIRPSPAYPLPPSFGDTLPPALKGCAYDAPFLAPPPKTGSIHHDHDVAVQTLQKITEFDAHPDVLVVLAHDISMDGADKRGGGMVPWFPEEINQWQEKGVKEAVRWKFLEKGNGAFRW